MSNSCNDFQKMITRPFCGYRKRATDIRFFCVAYIYYYTLADTELKTKPQCNIQDYFANFEKKCPGNAS